MGTGVAGWLMGLAGPLARQVLVALGFGLVTYAGLDAALNAALGAAKSSWGAVGGMAGAMLAMSGANTALSIIAGAVVARVSFVQLKRLVPK